METGTSISFPLAAAAARDALSHLRSLGYECADLQSFAKIKREWERALAATARHLANNNPNTKEQ